MVHSSSPPCEAVLGQVVEEERWAENNAIQPSYNGLTGYFKWAGSEESVEGPADAKVQVSEEV